nr:MAG TPA_asm: hypothetical protein [Caudoviricetes sp.]
MRINASFVRLKYKKISARWGALTRALLAYIQLHMFKHSLSICDWVERGYPFDGH